MKNALKICFPALILFLVLPAKLSGQQNNFRIYSIEDGLPQSEVMSLYQDSRGYLWVGTMSGGAASFDGVHFTVFNKKNGLSGNKVYCIFEDKKGILWFGTDEGLTVYDGYKFKNYSVKDGLTSNFIYKIFEDSKGNIWVCTAQKGVNIIKNQNRKNFKIDTLTINNGLSGNIVFDIIEDNFSRIWLCTFEGGLNVVTEKINHSFYVNPVSPMIIPYQYLLSMGKNKKGNVWFGTFNQGAFLVSCPDTETFKIINTANLHHGLAENKIWDIYCDEEGNTWFATDKTGLIRLDVNNHFTHFSEKQGVPSNQILCVFQDNEANIWFGTKGGGLCKYYGDYFANYTDRELQSDNIYAIAQSSLNTYWIGTSGKGLVKMTFDDSGNPIIKNYTEKDGLLDLCITSLAIDKKGQIWLASQTGGIYSFNGKYFTNYTMEDGLIDNRVNCLFIDSKNRLWIGTEGGLSIFDEKGFFNISEDKYKLINNEVQVITEAPDGTIWVGTLGGIVKFKNNQMTDFDEKEGLTEKQIKTIVIDNRRNVWLGAFGSGLYLYDSSVKNGKSIRKMADDKILGSSNIYSVSFSNDSLLFVGTDKGFKMIVIDKNYKFKRIVNFDKTNGFIGIENNLNAILKDSHGNVWFGTAKGLTRFTPSLYKRKNIAPTTHIVGLKLFFESIDWSATADTISPWFNLPQNLELSYKNNHLTFLFEGISLTNPQKVKYRYMLEGVEETWSPPVNTNEVVYSGLVPGNYTFKLLSANENGLWNKHPQTFNFVINPPWYLTWWAITGGIFVIIILVFSYIKYREAKLKRDKVLLEKIVKERTAEVVKQKEIVELQKQEITDSIHYASRIQRAILPTDRYISSILKDYFILYKPKDIVSGDFYWATKVDTQHATSIQTHLIVAVADCTGHGVPGAFMSMLGVSFLNEIVNEKGLTQSNKILNLLRNNIISALQQQGAYGTSKDGMDISLISIDTKNNIIQYSGAYNSLLLIRNNELIEFKADKMPIAIYDIMNSFNLQNIPYQTGDIVYLFSDGYVDQFGGPKSKKFMIKQFKSLLLSIFNLPMNEQHETLNKTIEDWKNQANEPQNDDICVIGLKF
ncbi:MAG: hypothetical protein COX07_05845 [Bacteroidetes bacterium CG23_combo_of_CG06-09_8_20_14_all_32_9]|nr:MAG: hypothetical protein COX07_05845 [Bacteroidetes bacterium CG23_combo_of_CG06-09_8_20_14_all_32_9]